MNGLEDAEDGPDDFRPVPHPDDRLWRHPAEMAAMHAAAQRAQEADDHNALDDTVELFLSPSTSATPPTDDAPQDRNQRVHAGLLAAALVVVVGASAIALSALSSRSSEQLAVDSMAVAPGVATSAIAADPPAQLGTADDLAIADGSDAENALALRIHDEISQSLPRIQAATSTGMREGSGMFVTNDGHLITSAGLVHDADYVIAWTADGRRWPATLIANDPVSDVAILSIDAETVAAELRQDAHLWSGQYALAIDHPNRTMNLGEVQSLVGTAGRDDRKELPLTGDPSSRIVIAPHAIAGSAIVDDTGSVIAMVNVATTDATTATPAWMLERVVGQLINGDRAHHTWLGAQVEPDLDASTGQVVTVFDGSPAEAAGLRSGDIIDSVDGEPLSTNMSLWTMIQMRSPGDSVDLAVTRHGQRRLISVTLDAWVGTN